MKANSANKQFRIKSLANSYVPLIEVSFASLQPASQDSRELTLEEREKNRLNRRSSVLGIGVGSSSSSSSSKRSSLIGGIGVGVGLSSNSANSNLNGKFIDGENLEADRNYNFEMTFSNPLDDAMEIKLVIAKQRSGASTYNNNSIPRTETEGVRPAKDSANWSVTPSANSFICQPYNEMLDLEDEDEDLLNESSNSIGESGGRNQDGKKILDSIEDDVEDETFGEDFEDDEDGNKELGIGRSKSISGIKGNASNSESSRKKKKGNGILRRKGHTTTIGLDLSLGKESKGDIEVSSCDLVVLV